VGVWKRSPVDDVAWLIVEPALQESRKMGAHTLTHTQEQKCDIRSISELVNV